MEDFNVGDMQWDPSEEIEPEPAEFDPSQEIKPEEGVLAGEDLGTVLEEFDEAGSQSPHNEADVADDLERPEKPDDSQISPRPYPRSRETLDNDEKEPQPDRTIRPPRDWSPGGPERGG